MTQEEYIRKRNEIKEEANKKNNQLDIEYGLSQNTQYKVGDIFEDNTGQIRIDKIGVQYDYYGFPICVFSGVVLTKNGKIHKNKKSRYAFLANEIKDGSE